MIELALHHGTELILRDDIMRFVDMPDLSCRNPVEFGRIGNDINRLGGRYKQFLDFRFGKIVGCISMGNRNPPNPDEHLIRINLA